MDEQLITGTAEELHGIIHAAEYDEIYLELGKGTNSYLLVKQDYSEIHDAVINMDDNAEVQWYFDDNDDLMIVYG